MHNLKQTVNLGTLNSFAVISDVHLANPWGKTHKKFIKTLKEIKNVEALILAGDIFEFIYASSLFFYLYWLVFFKTLKKLQSAGIKIIFIEGNHDYGFEHFSKSQIRQIFTYAGDSLVLAHHPIVGKVAFAHGDDLVCSDNYLKFRSLVKSKEFQKKVRFIPGIIMHIIFNVWAYISRKQEKYRQTSQSFIDNCLNSFCKDNTIQNSTIFLGHLHIDLKTTINTNNFIVNYSWLQQPNITYCDHNGNILKININ